MGFAPESRLPSCSVFRQTASVVDAPNDETISNFMLKIGSLGNVKSHTPRAFCRKEVENVLAKIN
jgi:uncharacterized protein with GYD domain